MTLAKKSLFGLILFMMIAVAVIIIPQCKDTSVDFAGYYAYDMLKDKDVDYILHSSLFEGVNTSTSHSASKHPNDQELKDKCLNGDGAPVLGMINPDTKHCVEVIKTDVEEGGRAIERFLVRVVKQVDGVYNEITAFTDEWESIGQVENYLNEGGYMHLWP